MAALGCISKGLSTVSDSYSTALLAYTLTIIGSQDRSYILAKMKSLAIKEGRNFSLGNQFLTLSYYVYSWIS